MHKKFLVVSNGRCGSTWMSTSLAQIPGVFSDYEFKWRPDYPLYPIHRKFTAPDDTCHDILAREGCQGQAVGSKITMDPWLTGRRPSDQTKVFDFFSEDRSDFIRSVPNDVIVIHIIRDYWSIFKSGFGRGYVHQVSSLEACPGTALVTAETIRALSNTEIAADPRNIGPSEVKSILASLILNDIYLRGLNNRGDRYVRVFYDEISYKFNDIVQMMVPSANWDAQESITNRSFTKKLPALDDSVVDSALAVKPLFLDAYAWMISLEDGDPSLAEYWRRFFIPLVGGA